MNKTVMCEFCYNYLKSNMKKKLFYVGTDSFIGYIKTDNIYKDIAEDVKKGLTL